MDYRDLIYKSYISNGFGDGSIEKNGKIQRRYYKINYKKYLPNDKACRILELGSGMGQFVSFLSNSGYTDITAVDTSKENINYCNSLNIKNVSFIKSDMYDFLKDKEEVYDVIVFNDIIEHLNKSEIVDILIKIRKALKKGGLVFIKTPNMANSFVNTQGRYIDFTHETGFTEFSMKQVLRATGFSNAIIKGTNIYVVDYVVSGLCWLVSKFIGIIMFLCSALFGRTSIRIFEKDILAIAYK